MHEEQKASKDIEALPGFTKIATIDYHWLVNQAKSRDFRQQRRPSQLAEEHRSVNVVAPGQDTKKRRYGHSIC
jgi:hypothetical protein